MSVPGAANKIHSDGIRQIIGTAGMRRTNTPRPIFEHQDWRERRQPQKYLASSAGCRDSLHCLSCDFIRIEESRSTTAMYAATFHLQLHRSVVIESALSATFAVIPPHDTVTSLAPPGFVSTSAIDPSGFFAAV
jgi:hypothetical protein